jgi:type VI secretion system protein ImpA
MPDEDGLATRLAPLTGLNGDESEGTLLAPIKMVPIVQKAEDRAMTCLSFDHAHELASLDETKRNLRLQQGAVSIQMFDTAVANSSAEFFVNLLDDLKKCLDEYDALTGVLQEKCGSHAPPSSNIRNTIEGCLATVQTVAKPKLEEAGVAVADGNGAAAAGAQAGESGAVAVGAIRTREDAFRTLLQVAEYFRRNEPHTPVSYALEQVVRWGKMSLPDLLLELIPEDSPRSNLYRLVGIKPPEKS